MEVCSVQVAPQLPTARTECFIYMGSVLSETPQRQDWTMLIDPNKTFFTLPWDFNPSGCSISFRHISANLVIVVFGISFQTHKCHQADLSCVWCLHERDCARRLPIPTSYLLLSMLVNTVCVYDYLILFHAVWGPVMARQLRIMQFVGAFKLLVLSLLKARYVMMIVLLWEGKKWN